MHAPVCEPANCSRNSEQHREEIGGEAHGAVNQTRVEINIRVELTLDEVGIGESYIKTQTQMASLVEMHDHVKTSAICTG